MIQKILSLLLAFLMVLPAGGAADPETDAAADSPALSLFVINVRKADALLLRCGSSTYLIDTGTEDGAPALLKVLQSEGITHLDGIILTHTDKDHVGGLEYLLDSDLEVDQVYASGYFKKKENKHPAVQALKGTGQEVVWLLSGDSLPLDGGRMDVLGPLEKSEDKDDNNSLVILVTGGGGTMLLAGDMEFPEERSLLSAGLIPRADVLKVGNHGDDDATSEEFLAAVSPSVAVISTNSDDKPETPSNRVMNLLNRYGVTVYLTQETENGVLITLTNGSIAAESK